MAMLLQLWGVPGCDAFLYRKHALQYSGATMFSHAAKVFAIVCG